MVASNSSIYEQHYDQLLFSQFWFASAVDMSRAELLIQSRDDKERRGNCLKTGQKEVRVIGRCSAILYEVTPTIGWVRELLLGIQMSRWSPFQRGYRRQHPPT